MSLSDWWRRLRGTQPEPAERPAATARPAKPKPTAAGELELAEGATQKRPKRTAAAGFDPYASDGGFAKPSTWERLDHD